MFSLIPQAPEVRGRILGPAAEGRHGVRQPGIVGGATGGAARATAAILVKG